MTRAPSPTEKSKKQIDNTKNATKNFDYTMIADQLRTVGWGNDSHSTGVVKPFQDIFKEHILDYSFYLLYFHYCNIHIGK